MDAGDLYKASSSLRATSKRSSSFRANSSNIWRNTGIEVFSRSSREEDDEEALKWAALEKLPTFDRLRKGLLFGSKGANEVEVQNLGFEDKRNLVERLVNTVEDDNEKFLLKLRNRIDRVGIDMPTIEVRYEHLNIDAEAYSASRALPTFINFNINMIEGFLNSLHILPSRKKPFTILKDVSGIIKPCRMTLLLGPPSSGKTTLLLALAGKLDPALKVSGRVTYNGHGMEEFVPQRTAAYISQHDLHIGEMTVRETLAFSARCQGVGSRYEMLAELSRREKAANIKPDPDVDIYMKAAATEGDAANVVTDYIIKVLGLDVCADTLVGDEMIRGISGGQKKRVTTGEMIVGPAKALFMDEISTGLDSSTTYQIVNMLRQYVHIMKGTAFISLLQPAPETYDLFDDIVLLADGQIVYQGPRESVLGFFESMGFKCPERKGVADFLQEVTSKKDQQQYWARRDEPYHFISVSEFAEAFQSYVVGRRIGDELAVPFDKTKSHPAALTTQKYGLGKKELLKACTDRELLLMKRNSFVYYFKLFQASFSYCDVIYCHDTLHSELAMTIYKLPVFYKQRDMYFFPAWAYAIPSWVLKIPITFIEVAIWTFLTYYVIGFDPNVNEAVSAAFISSPVSIGIVQIYWSSRQEHDCCKYIWLICIAPAFCIRWLCPITRGCKEMVVVGYWSSPLMYAQNAILVNEFTGHSWSKVVNGTKLGILVMQSRGFFPHAYWYWLGVGRALAFNNVKNATAFEKPQAVLPTEAEDNIQKGGSVGRVSAQGASRRRSISSGSSSARADAIEVDENRKRGMILPFEPHSITFEDIRYSVDMPEEMKSQGATEDKLELLKGISGAFRPGVLTALMGVSGAGKTTLMDVLAGRKTGGYIEGNITISGYPKNQATFARISGYCEQNDIHSPNVTVYESLVYSAWLRLPREVDTDTRKMFIDEVMELVELTPLSGALVGLDARAAAIVMRTVRNTVNTGRTVVCTIHQPSIDIFEAFDELLMKRGGQEIYVGPLGRHSTHLIKYFEGIDGVPKIKDGHNPATWMLEVTTSAQELLLGVDFTEHYRNSELYTRNKALIKELSVPRPGTKDLYFPTKYSQSFLTQCIACLWKQHWSYWRNPPYSAVRFVFTTFIALIFGTMFWDLGSKWKTQQDSLQRHGFHVCCHQLLGFQYGSTVQPVVAIERTVFYREKAAGMYSALPYAFSQFLIEIPYVFVQSLIYSLIVYSMMGFDWTAEKFFWFIYFMFFSLLYFVLYGMMTVAVTPNHNVAAIISSSSTQSGICSQDSLSHDRLYGFIVTQFGDIEDVMDSGETVKDFLRSYFGFKRDMLGPVAAILLGFVVLFTFIFAYSIRTFNFQRR
ncbi:UNVERIFIED_CONTAM: Pleiotropic drug resistance protein 1 [Sesamum calycinum]|uniref:Pleiotropic drug resistance protein 1 n=1 Tax=Sesamum calycinum TaxID=2727403 RepID=A0AAW2LYP7_9LAMI